MMPQPRSLTNAAPAIALIAPPALLVAFTFLGESVPASAPAAMPAVSAAPPVVTPTDTAAHLRASEWLETWSAPESLPSPMLHPERKEEAPRQEEASPRAETPNFIVKTVMGAGDRVMASINGKVLRVGDEPAPGWRIVSMDAKSKQVELKGPQGQSLTIAPQAKPR